MTGGPPKLRSCRPKGAAWESMGRPSGGACDAGVASASSSSGRLEPSAPEVSEDVIDQPGQRTMDDPPNYYGSDGDRSYYEQDRRWRLGMQAGYGFFAVFAFFAFFLSMWILFGLYGSRQLEMGMFYSRVITASSFFVKKIKVQNLQDKGPVAYSFSTRPELASPVSDTRTIEDITVEQMSHQRKTYWLNKGSNIELSCTLKDSEAGTDSLIVAIVKGESGFEDWKRQPGNPSLALRWKLINGKGSLSLKVEEDGEYCIVFGNLNDRKMTFSVNLDFRYALYSFKNADLVCSSQLADTCEFPVALGQSTYVLLTSPVANQYGVDVLEYGDDVWKIELSYVPRWIIYIFCWVYTVVCLVAGVALFTRAFELRQASSGAFTSQEHAPLLRDEAAPVGDDAAPVGDDADLCSVCWDAPKDSFFDPCGHRCTCYSCGMRIQSTKPSHGCPICRQDIHIVRRIYDA